MTDPISPVRLHKQLSRVWGTGPRWHRLAAVNHNILGRRFIVAAFVFFAIGGLLAMLIRAQLATPNSAFLGPDVYNQVFTMHGAVMMFLFAIPMFEGLAIYLLPKLLGARDLAFPRMTAYGFWCYIFGGAILVGALILGVAPNSGWFLYTPLSSQPYTPGINSDIWLLGVTFVEISAITAAVEILVTILKMRAPGMSLDRMPIFAWYMLVTAGMMLIGFPPLILGSILLELERAFDLPFFDPTRGGDPLLWQHLFWLFGHPEVYIIFLPAAGALSTMIPVFAGHPLVGYRLLVAAIIAMGFLSFGLWVHHMFTVGIPHLALAFFSAASALVAIPTAIQIFAWIAMLAQGRARYDIPMLYIFGFFVVFVLGGLTGVMLAMVPFNTQAHDSYFVVAHLHYVLVGGFVFPMLAAAYYWLPHFSGRLPLYRLSVPAFWLIFIGFNLTFFLMHLTGLMGMPRRIHTYPSNFGWDWLNLLSSVGGFLLTMGFALILADIILQFRFGQPFRRDPWRAGTLEWAMPTKPTPYNFASLPHIDRRADQLEPRLLGPHLAGGRGYLGFVREERMETLGVDAMTGEAEQVIILPNTSFLPLWTALATGLVVLAMLFKIYVLAALGLVLVIGLFLCWTPGVGLRNDTGPLPIGLGKSVPPAVETPHAPAYMAMAFGLGADAVLYLSLLFGALFLTIVAPNWQGVSGVLINTPLALVSILAGMLAAFSARRAVAANRGGNGFALWSVLAAIMGVAASALAIWLILALPDPTSHAFVAIQFAILLYLAVHWGIAVLLHLYHLWRGRTGYISAMRDLDLRLGRLWSTYSAGAHAIGIGMLFAMSYLAAIPKALS